MTDPAARGKANRRKGHEAELKLCAWLRLNGFPHAERSVRTGFTAGGRTVADHGDISGIPGVVVQVKAVARSSVPSWLRETEEQRRAAGAEYGVLVRRIKHVGNAALWKAWLLYPDDTLDVFVADVATVFTKLREVGYGHPAATGASPAEGGEAGVQSPSPAEPPGGGM